MLLLRSIAFNIAFYLLLSAMLVLGLPLLATSEQTIKRYGRLWSRLSLSLLAGICRIRVEYRHRDRVPVGGFILAAKHQSFLDILILLPLAPHFTFVMKRELSWIPLFGQFVLRAGMIAIDRSKGRSILAVLTQRVKQAVQSGQQLIIFPEGTRRPPGAEPAYKSGVAHLYAATGRPCVPVSMNAGLFWPRRSFMRYPGTLVVQVLEPVAPGREKVEFLDLLQTRIETAGDAAIAEARAGGWGRPA